MPLRVSTARLGYVGADALDITRKSGGTTGEPFAPSWSILSPALDARHHAEQLRKQGNHQEAERREAAAWDVYAPKYLEEMRSSYARNRARWNELLARPSVTLLCYCPQPTRCHRTLLAGILEKLGAEVVGEVKRAGNPEATQALLDLGAEIAAKGPAIVEPKPAAAARPNRRK